MTYKIKKKISCEKIKYYEKDEKKASNEYKKYGFSRLSKDEKRHYNFFKKLESKKCKGRNKKK